MKVHLRQVSFELDDARDAVTYECSQKLTVHLGGGAKLRGTVISVDRAHARIVVKLDESADVSIGGDL